MSVGGVLKIALVWALVATALAGPSIASGGPSGATATAHHVGDLVAVARPAGPSGCDFTGMQAIQLDPGMALSLHINDQCEAVVSATGADGSLGEQVDGIVAASPAPIAPASGNSVLSAGANGAAPTTTCRNAKQWVFTFGFGGAALDKLTHDWSAMTYCYTDTYVWGTSTAGSGCSGQSEPSWNWVVDACVYSSQQLSQSTVSVYSVVRGNYHCAPPANLPCSLSDPDGYFHRLFNKVLAYPGGQSVCTFWWDGQIVLGPESQILSGCP